MKSKITDVIGPIPYRLALAGGWIDQPFMSKANPESPGSMVVLCVEPEFRFMDRAGICTSTRDIALELWKDGIPTGDPAQLVRELYETENKGKAEPSGSQDMIGLIYPGISRLDYSYNHESGIFPEHIESCNDKDVAHWLESVLKILPVCQRPQEYNPLGEKQITPDWAARLGRSGKDCFDAILQKDITALGDSMNACMRCWETLLPHTVRHPAIKVDLRDLLDYYQGRYPGAMYSGCGGGYLFVVSEQPVEGAFEIRIHSR
ncbi:MAG: hypothetical protein K9N52_10630 [Verrucomicrobia bacterium]|nr:hypothetical protein [Verrucomicrobiota bacterium]